MSQKNTENDSVAQRHFYWLRDDGYKNFGDFLAEFLLSEVFLRPEVEADVYRLIGSTIHDGIIASDLAAVNHEHDGVVAFWCCGLRDESGLSEYMRARSSFFGVRGPLTRDVLGLPDDCVLGDPGFLVPILVQPGVPSGKSICVPHFHDKRDDASILTSTGVDHILRPSVHDMDELRSLIREIASASFVLAGSLHAAILACAYGVPFACWDSGYLDLPFKWRDFAASINTPLVFARDLKEGRLAYDDMLAPTLRKPACFPILAAAPFQARPSMLIRALVADRVVDPQSAMPIIENLQSVEMTSHAFKKYENARAFWDARLRAAIEADDRRVREAMTIEAQTMCEAKTAEAQKAREAMLASERAASEAMLASERAASEAIAAERRSFAAKERELWSHLQARIDSVNALQAELVTAKRQLEVHQKPARATMRMIRRNLRKIVANAPLPKSWRRKAKEKLERDARRLSGRT